MGCEVDPKAMASEDARTHDTKHTHVEPMRVCSFRLNKTQMVYMYQFNRLTGLEGKSNSIYNQLKTTATVPSHYSTRYIHVFGDCHKRTLRTMSTLYRLNTPSPSSDNLAEFLT